MLEASALSTLDKMTLFNQGARKENLKACKDSKLWDFRATCIRNALDNALYQTETEMINRGLIAVRTSPIIAHNVANSQKTAVSSSQNTNKVDPNTFLLSINDIQPADTSFLINHIKDSDWNTWFRRNIIDNLSESKADPEDLLRVMFVYLVTLAIMKDDSNALRLVSLIKHKINWAESEITQYLSLMMQNEQLMARFEDCINFSLINAAGQDTSAKSSLQEKIEKHDILNPKLWNEDGTLKGEVHDKIIEIADEFIDWLKEDEIKFDLKDIRIVGSNCSYNYTEDSDLDVHLIADASTLDCPDDLYPLLYSSYRSLFNKNLDIDFYGIPVEIYVEVE